MKNKPYKEFSTIEVKCRKCKKNLHGKDEKDVGYCLPCFAILMSDEEE